MTLIGYLFNWHVINGAMPFFGILASAYILFSKKTCTANKAISTALSLSIMLWLMLIWADWGSAVFAPSYQSMWARIFLLIVSALIMFELRRNTINIQKLHRTNSDLKRDNQRLKVANQLLLDDHSTRKGTSHHE